MSWLSSNTGRPKEEEGHERINVSLNLFTRNVLDSVENRSKLIEYCMNEFVQPKWLVFDEPKMTINYGSTRFLEGASFEFIPHFKPGNAVLKMNCCFYPSCEMGDVAFRVTVNRKRSLRLIQRSSKEFSCSWRYDAKDLGFGVMGKAFYNQSKYIFKFEFKPVNPTSSAAVKDIHFEVNFVENPLLKRLDAFFGYL